LGATSQLIAAEPPRPWKAEAELGIVATSGNTETTSVKAHAGVVHEQGKWRHTGKVDALNTSDATRTTGERYALSGKSDYKFDARSYVFGLVTDVTQPPSPMMAY
jgi:putative salt-induced outer membrane protein